MAGMPDTSSMNPASKFHFALNLHTCQGYLQ